MLAAIALHQAVASCSGQLCTCAGATLQRLARTITPWNPGTDPLLCLFVLILVQTGLKVASLQEQSTANRKKLADATRDFKRSSSAAASAAECNTAAGNLLRQYQDEIDTLTRRAKHAESAFLDLYEQLVEVRELVKQPLAS